MHPIVKRISPRCRKKFAVSTLYLSQHLLMLRLNTRHHRGTLPSNDSSSYQNFKICFNEKVIAVGVFLARCVYHRTEAFTLQSPVYETGAPIGANDRSFLLTASLYNTHIFLIASNCRWENMSVYPFQDTIGI